MTLDPELVGLIPAVNIKKAQFEHWAKLPDIWQRRSPVINSQTSSMDA